MKHKKCVNCIYANYDYLGNLFCEVFKDWTEEAYCCKDYIEK